MKNYLIPSKSFILTAGALFLLAWSSCKKEQVDPYFCSGGDGILCDVAGISGELGGAGNGKDAHEAFLYWPMDVFVDAAGIVMIVDFNNHCVRKIEPDGIIDRLIGSGILGDDPVGMADGINLNHPTGIISGPDGNLYLSAWHNWKVKHIDVTSWAVTSPVGTSQGYAGDGGAATQAKLDLPVSTVFDPAGNMYISDQGNSSIRKVDLSGNITTLAGNGIQGFAEGTGSNAQFDFPKGSNATPGGKIEISNDGTYLLVADSRNNRIRKVILSTGEVSTIAGTGAAGYTGDGGQAIDATLDYPADVAVGTDGTIYFADGNNHVIRKIDPQGIVSTVVGTGVSGSSPNGTKAKEAMLNKPHGIFITADNILYIADTYNQQVKKVKNP